MKICTKCKDNKEKSKFYKTTINKDGLRSECKECSKNTCQNTRLLNKSEKIKNKKCEFCNIELGVDIRLTSDTCKNEQCKKERRKKYAKNNASKMCAISAKRYAAKLDATPKNLTKEDWNKINEFYKEANRLTKETGIPHHVDHIVPLQPRKGDPKGEHAPWNLQVLTAEKNLKKSNKNKGAQ